LQEVFHAGKGMALAMCLWGFASYLYGDLLYILKRKQSLAVVVAAEYILY